MFIATAVLWPFSVVVAYGVGCLFGLLLAIWRGGQMVHSYARHLDSTGSDCEDEQSDADEEERERLDALTIRNLMRVSSRVACNEDALKTLQLGDVTALHNALRHAEDRFADWIDWAERVSDAMNRLEPDEDGAAV